LTIGLHGQVAESEEELIKKLTVWKNGVQSKGMKVSMNITKVIISAESYKRVQNTGRWVPRGVCGRGVGRNSISVRNGCTGSVLE